MAVRKIMVAETALTFDDLDGSSNDLRPVDYMLLERARLCIVGALAR